MITPAEWTLFLLILIFLLTLVLGLDESPLFLLLSGVSGIFLALTAFQMTDSIPVAILLGGMSLLLVVFASAKLIEGESD